MKTLVVLFYFAGSELPDAVYYGEGAWEACMIATEEGATCKILVDPAPPTVSPIPRPRPPRN